ncbi:MAG: DUF3373 family protein [Sulfuricurvum sp.]|nr:DUF3373 family protein [Sulfuricurvum sp.]
MKHRFLGSVVAAALMSTTIMAEGTMLQRFEAMEKEMNALKAELANMKAEKSAPAVKKVVVKDDDEDEDEKPAKATSGKIKIAVEKDDDQKSVPEQLEDIHDQLSTLNKRTNGNNLKFGVDFRTSYDNLQYKMADGSKQKNDALFSNRLWLNMNYAATKNLSFTGQLAYNKLFGQRSTLPTSSTGMDGFDWVSSEAAHNDTLRVRSAYFYYQDDEFLGADIPWTLSIGRRPSTNGHLINLRDDDPASSPLAHTVNVEFDGASAKFGMEELTGLDGSYFKLCAGRGMSNAEPRFSSAPYSGKDATTNNVDMIGVIVVPYDDKQYSVGMQYTYANNLIDRVDAMSNTDYSMETVGGLHTATAFAMVNGIGNGWSEFLDDTTFFVSGAMSKTNPKATKTMLGSNNEETGYSYWLGAQFPSLISDEGRWGVEFNHGSNNWRPITYGEDSMIGSKIAVRGDAYEVYFTEPLVGDILTFQLRYTYIDYDYAGSNGFFGSQTGTPTAISSSMPGAINFVDKAQDIRAYIRYRF